MVSEALRYSDERAHAGEGLARCGDDTVSRLVLETTDTQRPAEYRFRVLRAIDRIGSGPRPLPLVAPDRPREKMSICGGTVASYRSRITERLSHEERTDAAQILLSAASATA